MLSGEQSSKKWLDTSVVISNSILVFLSLMGVAAPAFFLNIKLLLVITFFGIVASGLMAMKSYFDRLLPYIVLIVPGLYGVSRGIAMGNPGAASEAYVYIYAPIIYLVTFGFFANYAVAIRAIRVSVKAACVINIAVFLFLYFSEAGYLRDTLVKLTQFVVQYPDGYIKAHSLHTTALVFIAPTVAGFYYLKRSAFNWLLVSGAILIVLFSGRKSVIVLFAVMTLLVLSFDYLRNRNLTDILKLLSPLVTTWVVFVSIADFKNAAFFGAVADSVAIPSFKGDVGLLTSSFAHSESFARSENVCSLENAAQSGAHASGLGAIIRQIQAQILFREVMSSPIFGKGLGYVVETCIRSDAQPWRFELGFLSLTMNVGLLGVMVYVLNYAFWVRSAIKNRFVIEAAYPLIVGSAFFIFCSATNPYIFSVENLWIYFIPYAVHMFSKIHNPA